MPVLEHLALYSKNCKRCGHLDPQEATKYDRCHFSKGNTECPAAEIQFVIVGRAKKLAAQLLGARKARQAETEAQVLATVAAETPAFKARFYDHLESLERDSCSPSKSSSS